MKNLITKFALTGLFALALLFTSCQEEFEEVGGDQQETITASSTTASLIKKTSSNDGSFDNIVDSASCFAVNFPYTVNVNGVEITIDSREDLHAIEEIFDEVDVDDDILEILFPITITFADFTELVIENADQLEDLAEGCLEGGDDDDIECIDFVYPITLFTFDINEQQTGEFNITSDEDLRKFFDGLEDDDLVSIQFPVTLKKFDGTEIVVDSNAELAMALEQAEDECDEDDDDDYNDDDFDEERFDFCLTQCPWVVREVVRDNVDQTDQYFEYVMNFTEDGGVTVKDREGNVLNGTWSARFTDRGPLLTLEFDVLVDFNLEWLVYEIGDHTIKLFAENGNKIIMRQHCPDDDGDDDPDTLREILKECEWIIKKVKNQGEEIRRLLGYEFNFMADGVVTLSDGITTIEGTWEVGLNNEEIPSLLIEMPEDGVSFDWPLRDLDDHRLKFEVEEIGYELVLLRVCDDSADDGDIPEIRNILFGGPWNVASYTEDGMDMTDNYTDMDFNFSTMHQVEVSVNDDPIAAGLWRVLRDDDGNLKFFLNFDNDGSLTELTDDWYINEVDANRIELVHEDENSTEILVFEKP
ncbi:hypothetical protein [Flagellimonas allohymeniacidonis]|uniref:Lipocalin-like domain-containing protein n=1 Tax=Flagellimonas allohymeniacidonis TaxID=2517819 RepID=A0A4Q8QJV7_9FLAO|nr:hypothetical protein [Allomuricauda hymeniacidonis]TAI49618.1 hypothetical protein EW142_07425 [Allomuricauda hymeniacidonis]